MIKMVTHYEITGIIRDSTQSSVNFWKKYFLLKIFCIHSMGSNKHFIAQKLKVNLVKCCSEMASSLKICKPFLLYIQVLSICQRAARNARNNKLMNM